MAFKLFLLTFMLNLNLAFSNIVYDKDDINLKYLSAKSNKKLSVGFKSIDHRLNDLIIEVDAQNIEIFISECIKYLEIFFTNKK